MRFLSKTPFAPIKAFDGLGAANELNAAYAADGYARIHGAAALNTTYAVGELSAINGVAGSYAEYLPVFHLAGMPASRVQTAHRLVHHTLGNGEFDMFYKMAEPVVCARTIMTPDNCVAETERLIAAALYHRRPVYMAFPSDYVNMPVISKAEPVAETAADPVALEAAVNAVVGAVSLSKTACILPGIIVSRWGLSKQATAMVDASGLPFATMSMDKCALDETHPNFIGMYDGKLMNEEIRAFVEGCDCVLGIGAMLTDFNSGSFTARIDRSKSINIMQDSVRGGLPSTTRSQSRTYWSPWLRNCLGKTCRLPECTDSGNQPASRTTRLRWNTSTLVGSRCLGQMTYSLPKLEQPRWGSVSLRCPKDRRSRTRRYGVPSVGPRSSIWCCLVGSEPSNDPAYR
jgi:TPP-dependent 2-oxoacid decarboxylase